MRRRTLATPGADAGGNLAETLNGNDTPAALHLCHEMGRFELLAGDDHLQRNLVNRPKTLTTMIESIAPLVAVPTCEGLEMDRNSRAGWKDNTLLAEPGSDNDARITKTQTRARSLAERPHRVKASGREIA